MALAKPGDISWDKAFDGATWFHITGITPAISASAADLALEAMRLARQKGLMVSFDLNYRRNLWKWGKLAQDVMGAMLQFTDLLIGNEQHLRLVLELPEPIPTRELTDLALKRHLHLKAVSVSLRAESWSACLNDREKFLMSRSYDVTNSVDRVGSGDAFAAGLIYGWLNFSSRQDALDFGAAACCLKHSIPGDYCRATAEEVQALLNDSRPGQIIR
jgi:2-dehydro-3-deoxygluconokinase